MGGRSRYVFAPPIHVRSMSLTTTPKDAVAQESGNTGPANSSRSMAKPGLSQRADDDEDVQYEGEGIVGDDEFD